MAAKVSDGLVKKFNIQTAVFGQVFEYTGKLMETNQKQ